jgi:hypothetical protein
LALSFTLRLEPGRETSLLVETTECSTYELKTRRCPLQTFSKRRNPANLPVAKELSRRAAHTICRTIAADVKSQWGRLIAEALHERRRPETDLGRTR